MWFTPDVLEVLGSIFEGRMIPVYDTWGINGTGNGDAFNDELFNRMEAEAQESA